MGLWVMCLCINRLLILDLRFIHNFYPMRIYSKALVCFSLIVLLTSCINEERSKSIILGDMEMSQFQDINFDALQQSIDDNSDIKNGMDALRIYYPNDQSANSGNLFTTKSVSNKFGSNYLFFKQEKLKDDSLQAIAFYMEYNKSMTGKIEILDFKESFLCQEGRGHQEWSGELCN